MDGLPVVLVHGGGHGAWCWEPMLGHLTTAAIAVDLPPKAVRGGPDRFADLPELRTLTVANLEASPGGRVEVLDLDTGHDAMLSRPRELAAIIDRIAVVAV